MEKQAEAPRRNGGSEEPRTPSPDSPLDDSPTLGYEGSPKSHTSTSTVTGGNGGYFPTGNGNGNSKSTSTYSRSTRSKNSPPTRLGAIDETTDAIAPDVPVRSPQRAHRAFFHSIFPPILMKPPEDPYNDVKGPHGEKFSDLRANNKNGAPANRGGWRTWICIGCVLVALTAIAAIGIVIGLTLKHKAHSSHKNDPQPSTNATEFPAGSYSIITALTTVTTACTSNPATWRCYPYATFNESSSGSQTTFDWIVSSGANDTYTISSTNNPFSLVFMNEALALASANTLDQHYTFSVPLQKVVYPTVALTSDSATTECFYNNTMLTGNLYTNRTSTYPGDGVSKGDWPYAVEISQSVTAGSGVPDCYRVVNGVAGEKVDVASGENGGVCECGWRNDGT